MKKIIIFLISYMSYCQVNKTSDIRGRDCDGGLGICGSIEVVAMRTNQSNQKHHEFFLVLTQEKVEAMQLNATNDELFFELKEPIVLDELTIKNHNLDPHSALIKEGLYPIILQDRQYKIRFTLSKPKL